jgi:hypothetical protein
MGTIKSEGNRNSASSSQKNMSSLRDQRLAHEKAQKEAGVWGDLSVATITRDGELFVHCFKGNQEASLYDLALKRPKEMSPEDHERLVSWLKRWNYEGFVRKLAAWNVSAEEAARIKAALIEDHQQSERRVVNAP